MLTPRVLRLLVVNLAIGGVATAALAQSAERWLPIAPSDASRGAMALNLNSIRPAAQKGIDEATALEVSAAGAAYLDSYQVRCGRGLVRAVERRPIDRHSGEAAPPDPVTADWAKPGGLGEPWILQIVCDPQSAGGSLIADRRAAIWWLAHSAPAPADPQPAKAGD